MCVWTPSHQCGSSQSAAPPLSAPLPVSQHDSAASAEGHQGEGAAPRCRVSVPAGQLLHRPPRREGAARWVCPPPPPPPPPPQLSSIHSISISSTVAAGSTSSEGGVSLLGSRPPPLLKCLWARSISRASVQPVSLTPDPLWVQSGMDSSQKGLNASFFTIHCCLTSTHAGAHTDGQWSAPFSPDDHSKLFTVKFEPHIRGIYVQLFLYHTLSCHSSLSFPRTLQHVDKGAWDWTTDILFSGRSALSLEPKPYAWIESL